MQTNKVALELKIVPSKLTLILYLLILFSKVQKIKKDLQNIILR